MNCETRDFLELSGEILRRGNKLCFRAHGGSMWPFINDGDILTFELIDKDKLKPGDIILYHRSQKQAVVHRVVKILQQDGLPAVIAKGDFDPAGAEVVLQEAILGKVTHIKRNFLCIRIDRGWGRLVNMFFAGFCPIFNARVYPVLRGIKRIVYKKKKNTLNEDRLLYFCARAGAENLSYDKISEVLNYKFDWDYFLRKARSEGVSSLIYKSFLKLPDTEEKIPMEVLDTLKGVYYAVAKRNILISQALARILREFEEEAIRTIIFKGLALAESVYGDIGARAMSDVDILIDIHDLKKADAVLRKLNYATVFEINDFSEVRCNLYRNSFLYRNPDVYPRYIHLYWHVLNLYPYDKNILNKIDMDKIWRDSTLIELNGVKAATFSLYHQVIYLCMHVLNHAYSPLILLCDIHEVIRLNKTVINWDVLVDEAITFGLAKQVYYGLYVCSEIFGSEIPLDSLNKLKPKKISIFEKKFISSVIKREPVTIGAMLVYFGMNESLQERVLFLFRALFPSKREMAVIRQKSFSEITILDYLRRVDSALCDVFRSLLKR